MAELDQAIWTSNSDKADTHPYPGDREADIWVFSGQSNSQGWGMLKAPIEPDPRILFFDADNQWIVAREPLNPRFTSWVPDSVRENILLQRTGVNYPSGASAEIFTEEMERQKVVLGGVGPGLAFAKHLVKFLNLNNLLALGWMAEPQRKERRSTTRLPRAKCVRCCGPRLGGVGPVQQGWIQADC
jgi:hypothetical protein